MASPSAPDLILLFDGGCPLCVREVRFLRRRDRQARLAFVDIDASDYDAAAHAGISYRVAMGRIHAITGSGDCLLYTSPSPRDLSTSRMPSSA